MGKETPVAKQRQLVALWRQCGGSASNFASARGISRSTFQSWIDRYPAAEAPAHAPATPAFLQVLPCAASEASQGLTVTVEGHELRFAAPPPPAWFAALLGELARC
jgi:hypothetical protein